MKKLTKKVETFDIVNYTLLFIFTIIILYPLLNVISLAVSSETAVITGSVSFYPIGFQLSTISYVLNESVFWSAFKNSIIITAIGTTLSLFLTIITAYPLSKIFLPGRKIIINVYIFLWIFMPGLIPLYLLIRQLNLMNNLGSLIFPELIVAFNMLIMKNYFASLPKELSEAATVDGASVTRTLFQVILPVSKPVIATVGLFYAIYYWNSYIHATMFIRDQSLKPLQLYLYELISNTMGINAAVMQGADAVMNVSNRNIRATTVFLSMIPMLCIYPFVQRFLVKGFLLGAIKE